MRKLTYLFFLLWICSQAFSQNYNLINKSRGYFMTGYTFQTWKVELSERENQYDDGIFQMTIPFILQLGLSDKMTLNISNRPSMSWWHDEQKINGISDTWIKTTYISANERAMFYLGLGLPTGATQIDSVQYELSSNKALASRNYQFYASTASQGLCGQAGFNYTVPIEDDYMLGFGVQYIYRGNHHPVKFEYGSNFGLSNKWDIEYNPGDEIHGQVGFDWGVSKHTKLTFDFIYAYYLPDYLDNEKLYSSGVKYYGNVSYYHQFTQERDVYILLKYRHKENNVSWEANSIADDILLTQGDQVGADMLAKFVSYQKGELLGTAFTRYNAPNTDGFDESFIIGFGIGGNFHLSRNSLVHTMVKYSIGELNDLVKRDISGFEFTAQFSYSF